MAVNYFQTKQTLSGPNNVNDEVQNNLAQKGPWATSKTLLEEIVSD